MPSGYIYARYMIERHHSGITVGHNSCVPWGILSENLLFRSVLKVKLSRKKPKAARDFVKKVASGTLKLHAKSFSCVIPTTSTKMKLAFYMTVRIVEIRGLKSITPNLRYAWLHTNGFTVGDRTVALNIIAHCSITQTPTGQSQVWWLHARKMVVIYSKRI